MCRIGASLALTFEEERTFSVPQSKTWALTGDPPVRPLFPRGSLYSVWHQCGFLASTEDRMLTMLQELDFAEQMPSSSYPKGTQPWGQQCCSPQ